MGKCVSRQSTCPSPRAQHQSVLTIALSHQDLAQAHKIWQQLTASNEYIATTTAPTDEPTFYYHISRRQEHEQPHQQQQLEEQQKDVVALKTAAVLHIESVYNHLDAHANANVIGSTLTGNAYATCQEFLLHELAQTLDEQQVESITPFPADNNSSGISRPAAWQLTDSDSALEQPIHEPYKVSATEFLSICHNNLRLQAVDSLLIETNIDD